MIELDLRAWSILGALGLLLSAGAGVATAQTPTVTVESVDASFEADTDVTVTLDLEGAANVAGLDVTLEYDADRLASGEELTTHVDGGLFGLLEVNHEFSYDEPTRRRQIKVAAVSGEALGSSGGTLLELTFPVTCLGYAQAFPDGRDVTVSVAEVNFFDENSQPIAGGSVDGVLSLDCTSVPVADGETMSTLKSLYRQ